MTARREFDLRLAVVADPWRRVAGVDRDPEIRLRAALKVLLRSFGLRCVTAKPADPTPTENRP